MGGIRRIIVPVELGYPENDWRKLGPLPNTFTVSVKDSSFLESSRNGDCPCAMF